MSSLTLADRHRLENLLDMSSGYVLDFSDKTFGEFVFEAVHLDIHCDKYTDSGTSKAKKLRSFWLKESDYVVGTLLASLIDYKTSRNSPSNVEDETLEEKCREIATRLLAGSPRLGALKKRAEILDERHLAEQIRRLEASVESDPSLAIGTAKELVETCCKTILAERGKPVVGTPEMPALTKATLKELKLVPEGVPDGTRGAEVIKRLLANLGTIGNGLAELRGLYGTGHGKHGGTAGLKARHAKLAVGAAATLAVFLFETHKETP
ncbi:MAG: abortive infection family protein [bacterium]